MQESDIKPLSPDQVARVSGAGPDVGIDPIVPTRPRRPWPPERTIDPIPGPRIP